MEMLSSRGAKQEDEVGVEVLRLEGEIYQGAARMCEQYKQSRWTISL